MKISDKSKLRITESVLDSIKMLTDKEFQERVWVRFEGPEIYSYADFICDFFPLLEMMIDDSFGFNLTKKQKIL